MSLSLRADSRAWSASCRPWPSSRAVRTGELTAHTLRLRGGGIGLFTGCAAGDTGAAVVVRVED